MPSPSESVTAITSDGALWLGDYTRGMLGRLDPKTGATIATYATVPAHGDIVNGAA